MPIIDNRADGGRFVYGIWSSTLATIQDLEHLPSWDNPQVLEEEKETYRKLWDQIIEPYLKEINELRCANKRLHEQIAHIDAQLKILTLEKSLALLEENFYLVEEENRKLKKKLGISEQ